MVKFSQRNIDPKKGADHNVSENAKQNNYEKTLLRAEKEFTAFDQDEIIAASNLRADDDYVYVTFFYAPYRVDRKTGRVEAIEADGSCRHATFNEGMSILDAICEPPPFRCLSGDLVDIGYFNNVNFNMNKSHIRYCQFFLDHQQRFQEVCAELGAKPYGRCDVGFLFDLFDFLPVAIQLWEGEEGIPPAMRFLWDRNTKDFLRFETMFYALGHVLRTLTIAVGGDEVEEVLNYWV